MSALRQIAQYVRHLPGLERADWLWAIARKPYERALEAGGRGVEIAVSGITSVRMPAAYAGGRWEEYEPKSMKVFVGWIRDNPGALILDVGSAIGIYSAVALFADAKSEAVAFDSDLESLAAVRRMCQYASGKRLSVVHGFVSNTSKGSPTLKSAVSETEEALIKTGVSGDIGTNTYICLTDGGVDSIPVRRLDDLFSNEFVRNRPLMLKCDVEGAELLVLLGSERLLREQSPTLLMSIHPPALPTYGHSKEGVAKFLQERGYRIECIDIDHEEHWFCRPS